MKTVVVTVEGGVVQHIEVPEGVQVMVYDYDVEGVEPSRLELDGNGNQRILSVWERDRS